MKRAIVFTANTPQVAQANLMLDSLRAPDKGGFKGDIWVISTGLSDSAKLYLDNIGINYFIDPMHELYEWKHWKTIAKAMPEYDSLCGSGTDEISLKTLFEKYRNKRMSKLIILNWYEKYGKDYDYMVLCDNDLYFQNDVEKLLEKYYSTCPERIVYWQEENEILTGNPLWKKNFQYMRLSGEKKLDFGKHEINIGFIMGKPIAIQKLFLEVKAEFEKINVDLITKYSWHDQDLTRLIRAKNPDWFKLAQEGDITHLCNGGMLIIEQIYPLGFLNKKTNTMPTVIHFAGGAWKKFTSLCSSYEIDPELFFYSQTIM